MAHMRLHMTVVYLFALTCAVAVRVWQIIDFTDYQTGNLNRDALFSLYILIGILIFCFLHIIFFSGYSARVVNYRNIKSPGVILVVIAALCVGLLCADIYFSFDSILGGTNILVIVAEIVTVLAIFFQALSFSRKKDFTFKTPVTLFSTVAVLINSYLLVSEFTGQVVVHNTVQHSFQQITMITLTLFLVCSAAYFLKIDSRHDYKLMMISSFMGATFLAVYIVPQQVLMLMSERPEFFSSDSLSVLFSAGLMIYLLVFGFIIIFAQKNKEVQVLG